MVPINLTRLFCRWGELLRLASRAEPLLTSRVEPLLEEETLQNSDAKSTSSTEYENSWWIEETASLDYENSYYESEWTAEGEKNSG